MENNVILTASLTSLANSPNLLKQNDENKLGKIFINDDDDNDYRSSDCIDTKYTSQNTGGSVTDKDMTSQCNSHYS